MALVSGPESVFTVTNSIKLLIKLLVQIFYIVQREEVNSFSMSWLSKLNKNKKLSSWN